MRIGNLIKIPFANTSGGLWRISSNATSLDYSERGLTRYIPGSLTKSPLLSSIQLQNNLLSRSDIDNIIEDLIESLNDPNRVPCVVNLTGEQNSGPSLYVYNKIYILINQGWIVNINTTYIYHFITPTHIVKQYDEGVI